ncbi:MAG: glycosyltransferase family 2 protein [Lachnospiraceae bacterium]|nr:glycosyltransferase family 2 protein [Lachnospiraceae bacterium]
MKKIVGKIKNYYREHGVAGVALRTVEKLTGIRPGAISYEKWYRIHQPDLRELERQRGEVFPAQPLFSILVPLFWTPENYLRELIASVQAQTYAHWELCLSDGSGVGGELEEILSPILKADSRIHYRRSQSSLGISENTNNAMDMAQGDFLVFADHDDLLAPDALYECARCIRNHPETDVIYTDEDKISMDGKKHFDPQLKPDFNPDLLRSMNYICHLFVVKRTLGTQVGELNPEFDGAQDYDYVFRCVEKAKCIRHIPRVLYHWRCHEDSTAVNQESKKYAFEAGKRAIQAHCDRINLPAKVSHGPYLGLYRTLYYVKGRPLVSVIIPNKDHTKDLERCIRAVEEKSTYRNVEYIIIENNSQDKETFAFYQELMQRNPKVKVVTYQGHFNYSSINNFGERSARGEYLLFLNNDTEMISEDCLEEMLGICCRPEVGAVGARLYYGDDTIQHAGVIVGLGGIAGHAFAGERGSATGYCRRIICTQDLSAVTAACMMVKKRDFERAGGFDEELEVAFNDVDLCLKLRSMGLLVVYTPYAQLYHYESKSRGAEDTPEKVERFHREIALFEQKWPEILRNGDPYYNSNLTLKRQDFTLKRFEKE